MAGNDDRDGIPGWAADAADGNSASPVPGVDWQSFRNFLTRALNGDESVPSVMLQRVHQALLGGETNLEKRDRKWWFDFFLHQSIEDHLRAIDGLIDRYNGMADWHHEQADKARARMEEAAQKLEEIGGFIDDTNEIFREKDKSGRFDREKAIRILESRGVHVDPEASEAAILAELRKQRERAYAERTYWDDEFTSAEADATLHDELEKENRRKAQELVERRDAIRAGGFDAEEEERRLSDLEKEYEIDVRWKAAEIEQSRLETEQAQISKVADQTAIAKATVQQEWKQSHQTVQADGDIFAELDALASGALTDKFTEVASVKSQPPVAEPPKPTGPAFSA